MATILVDISSVHQQFIGQPNVGLGHVKTSLVTQSWHAASDFDTMVSVLMLA